ncbi:MAG: hypothetical protein Q9180_001951 [Flavoplaca navasiana]
MATPTTDALVPEETVQSPTSSARILESAREQTGFDSYHEYLRFHNVNTREFEALCGSLRPLTDPREETSFPDREPNFQWGSAVLNLSEAGQLSVDESYCPQVEEAGCRGTDMAEALCSPPANTRLQIAIWDALKPESCEVFGDLIGLHYRLDPVVLRAIAASCFLTGSRHRFGLDRFAITHAKVGQVVSILLHPKNGTNAPPLLLIAGQLDTPPLELGWHLENIFETCPPFNKSAGDDKKQFPPAALKDGYNFYPLQLDRILSKYHDTKTSIAECTLLCLLPLLHLSVVRLRYWVSVTRDHFEQRFSSRSDGLYDDLALLRTLIDDMENDWWSIRRYMKLCFHCELSEMKCYHDADNDVKDFVEDARRLEGRVREHLQLQIGIKALEESKRSIEVSNQQIQEVKTFTILAFVYVPLNLASSIYGMNIQQLNGSGQSVWVFVVTAVIALLITAGTWYLSEATNTYRRWQRIRAEHDDRLNVDQGIKRPEFSVAERMAMIVWLQRKRYASWMRSTGAWWKILLNRSDPMTVVYTHLDDTEQTSAGDLVSRYSTGEFQFTVDLRDCKAGKSEEKVSAVPVP